MFPRIIKIDACLHLEMCVLLMKPRKKVIDLINDISLTYVSISRVRDSALISFSNDDIIMHYCSQEKNILMEGKKMKPISKKLQQHDTH